MSASRPESLSQTTSAILSKGDPRCCNVLRYLASSYGVRVAQQRYRMRIHLNARALTADWYEQPFALGSFNAVASYEELLSN